MRVSELPDRLSAMGIGTDLYSIGTAREQSLCIEQVGRAWVVYYRERGQWNNTHKFGDEESAVEYVISSFEEMLESRRSRGFPTSDLARSRASVEDRIRALGVGTAHYRIGSVSDNAWSLVEEHGRWLVFRTANGERTRVLDYGDDFDSAESGLFKMLRKWQREQTAAGVSAEALAADR